MEKGEVTVLAQLIGAMKDAVGKLLDAYNAGDMESLAAIKKEILKMQQEIDKRT